MIIKELAKNNNRSELSDRVLPVIIFVFGIVGGLGISNQFLGTASAQDYGIPDPPEEEQAGVCNAEQQSEIIPGGELPEVNPGNEQGGLCNAEQQADLNSGDIVQNSWPCTDAKPCVTDDENGYIGYHYYCTDKEGHSGWTGCIPVERALTDRDGDGIDDPDDKCPDDKYDSCTPGFGDIKLVESGLPSFYYPYEQDFGDYCERVWSEIKSLRAQGALTQEDDHRVNVLLKKYQEVHEMNIRDQNLLQSCAGTFGGNP